MLSIKRFNTAVLLKSGSFAAGLKTRLFINQL